MKISQLMRRDVVVAREAQSLKEAAAALVANGISGMPVCREDGQVVGVLSEADVLYKERGRTERRGACSRGCSRTTLPRVTRKRRPRRSRRR